MGENDESMFVHFGKVHSEKFDCGICECEVDTLENLEVHLVTCEVYECNHCDLKVKILSQMKTHIVKDHGNNGECVHLKMNRHNFEQVDSKTHKIDEI